jgi:DNA-binding CsgD family transcriptional regulator
MVVGTGPEQNGSLAVPHLEELRAIPGAELVTLANLTGDESAAVIGASGHDEDEVQAELHRRTGGNPALLSALLDALPRESGEVSTLVPERVRAWVATRLHRLGPDAVALARAIQVLGDDATLARSARLAELDRRAAEDAADVLVTTGVARHGAVLAFAELLVADVVGRGLEPFHLDRLHRRAAELLIEDNLPSVRVTHHLLRTTPGAEPWIVEALRSAAATANQDGDCARAATLLRRALDEPPVDLASVLSELAFAESRAGLPEAAATLEQALGLVGTGSERLMLLRERTRLMWLTGRLPEAVDTSEIALEEAEPGTDLHDELLAELLAVASMHDLAPIYARPKLVDLLERANDGWVPDSASLAATLATVLPFVLGDQRLVDPLVDVATREDLWRVDAPPFGMRPDFVIGSLWLSGGLERGTSIIREGMETVDQDNLFRHGLLWYWLGEIRYAAGDLPGTLEATTTALSPQWGPFLSWYGFSTATQAHAYLDLDNAGAAAKLLEETEDRLDPHQLYGIAADLARARLSITQKQPAEATRLLTQVSDRLGVLGHRDSPQIAWRSLAAFAAIRSGDRDQGEAWIAEEIAIAESTHSALRLGRALRVLSDITDPADRLPVLEHSAAVLAASEHALEHARSLFALGYFLHHSGDVPQARERLAAARELAQQCGAAPLANRALNALHATGARPRRTARTGVDSLTSTERRIADLAAGGATNREIAEALGIAPRTVEWHLRGAFAKLGVTSRREIAAALARR